MAFSLVDLRSCQFSGAQGLEGLHLEQVFFHEMPRGLYRHKKWRFPIWYSRRRWAIAEELRWRNENQPRVWRAATPPGSDRSEPCPTPHQIAAVYRALRSGREGRKDEPGAGDFYYGEMEMRRHTTYTGPDHGEAVKLKGAERHDSTRRPPLPEKIVLFLYWLTSGYGLRAGRALFALFVTVACGAVLLDAFGLPKGRSSMLVAVESSISLLRAPEMSLPAGGEVVTIALRLLGPLFFGLALLSLRGRIKR